jgi:hypothetical protein
MTLLFTVVEDGDVDETLAFLKGIREAARAEQGLRPRSQVNEEERIEPIPPSRRRTARKLSPEKTHDQVHSQEKEVSIW